MNLKTCSLAVLSLLLSGPGGNQSQIGGSQASMCCFGKENRRSAAAGLTANRVQDESRQAQVQRAEAAYGRLPLSFEINRGQADQRVKFLSRGNGYGIYLTATEAILRWARDDERLENSRLKFSNGRSEAARHQPSVLRIEFSNANPSATVMGLEELPGKSHYFIGNDPMHWQTSIANYSKVRYHDVYPGIDLVYYGNQRQLEYDLVVAPGANPRSIRLDFRGADKLEVDPQGDLLIRTGHQKLRWHRPSIYQEVAGLRREVPGKYLLSDRHSLSFEIGSFDHSRPLVIDPVLVYSTYLGSSGDENPARNTRTAAVIAVDVSGNAYLTGYTDSTDFPVNHPLQSTSGGSVDAFIAKLNASGSALLYSTYLGGSGPEGGSGIAVDASGNAYVSGLTQSSNFPTVNPLQSTLRGPEDAFAAKLNGDGSALLYSTFLGGSDVDDALSIAVDSSGSAYVTGETSSTDFPKINALQTTYGGGRTDAYVAKLNPAGSSLIYSTYLGGSGADSGTGVAVDTLGNAYLTGGTDSSNFRTANPLQPAPGGSFDGFIAKLNPSGSKLIYSTYLGGNSDDIGTGITVDLAGNAYVVGLTDSVNFPVVNAVQPTLGGGIDAFVVKVNATGSALTYSTYLGHTGEDLGWAVAVDGVGNAYVVGTTTSTNFPTVNAVQPLRNGNRDAFVTKLNATGTTLLYSTYLGGCDLDYAFGIAVDAAGDAYVTGQTRSPNFPTTSGVLQPVLKGAVNPSLGGASDAFITKISETATLSDQVTFFVPIVLSSSGLNNSFFTSELTLSNRGPNDASLQLTYTTAFGEGSGTASDSLAAGQQRIVPDAIAYLKSLGVPIPDSGNRGGTLAIRYSGLSAPSDAATTVRTTTTVAGGRAGLAYAGIPLASALTGTSYLCGLRQNATNRSNVAIQNAGVSGDGNIELRLTVFSGDPANPVSKVLPDETLSPGEFKQLSGILTSNGLSLTNGYVRVERISGTAPYYAYAVINDQANSDGSFVPPLRINEFAGHAELTLPVIVETAAFASELVITNYSAMPKTIRMAFVSDAVDSPDKSAFLVVTLNPGEQSIIPSFVQYLRNNGVPGVGPA